MSEGFIHGHALVIGVANYPKVNTLPEIVLKDARDVADLLQSPDYCGYSPTNVNLLLDGHATLEAIREGLRRLAQAAGPDDTAVVFFSGHGARKESGPNAGTYLLPVDCDPDRLRETALGSEELTSLLKVVRAQRLVILLDACHSGGTGELKVIAPVSEMKAGFDEKVYDRLAEGVGRVILASSRSSEFSVVLDGMQNSLFTHYLLEALRGAAGTPADDLIRVFDVFHYVSDKVPGRTPSQHPIFKAHEVENNFPLALNLGGKKAASEAVVSPLPSATRPRPASLSGHARLGIINRLVTRWEDLATYLEIPLADKAKFDKGNEPRRIMEWLEQRGRLQELRDAFNYLGWDDLIEELDRHPR
jgi:metacaspase-1